jgi:imidazolonepropionase-like amidohydrolase/Tol biopolymer transport system component
VDQETTSQQRQMLVDTNYMTRILNFYIYPQLKLSMKKLLLFCFVILSVCEVSVAQPKPVVKDTTKKKDSKKWDVENPPGTFQNVEFTTTEGTWMSLDVSPDGKEIAFDMLGDIYSMPITGGEAKLLRGGHSMDVQPRYSPDGKKISFGSDAGGGDNIWMMNRDGSDPKQITKENYRGMNNAVWMPAGNYLIAKKHFTSTRSLGAGELWMYHYTGGEGIQITKRKNDQQDLGEPSVSADGKYVYYSEDMYPGGYFQYDKDPNQQIYVIKRYNFEKGETETVTGGAGSAMRPQISKDGKTLAFVRRVHEKSVLYLRNMETGEEWPVYDKLSKDQSEAWAIFGPYCGFQWLDANNIVIWAQGKIWKLTLGAAFGNATATEIPFSVKVKQKVYDALHFVNPVAPDKFTVKTIRNAVTSPDEKYILFNAVGRIWRKDLPNGTPYAVNSSPANLYDAQNRAFEFEPSFSPDGNEMVFVSWDDEKTGTIYKQYLKATGGVNLTTEKGIYRTPRYSPDGKWIVYQKEEGNNQQGGAFCVNPGLYIMPATGGKGTLVIKDGSDPRFSKDGKRIFYQSSGDEKDENFALKSCDLNGKDIRTHFTSKYTNSFVVSPDNNWIAYCELFKVYVAAMPMTGKTNDISGKMESVPVAQVAKDAGINIHWSADSKKVHWTLGDEYFTTDLGNRFGFMSGKADSTLKMDTAGIKVNLILDFDKPKGTIAFNGARIITMNGGSEVIENGTIIVTENKITDIGASDKVLIPAGAKVMDMTGKTIMPGMIDVHAHLWTFRQGLSPQKEWTYFANLAYGVTTTHDPSSNTEMVFTQSEMVKAGIMTGPRIFSTGTILYGADGDIKAVINSLDDARSAIIRTKAFGAFSVKSYSQPRREQRQQVITAARELGIQVVPEGGSTYFNNISHILDGHTGVEHNLPIAPLYNDVVQLWSHSKTQYTPTLIVCYGAMGGETYWYQHTNIWEKQRQLNFTPRSVIDTKARHRMMIPEEEYTNGHILVSQSCKKLADAGVKINLGAHGQLNGIGAHWELWNLAQGGMTNMQALQCATINGATYIGMDKEIGSLEKGKLADLIILDKNPLESIYNSESVHYTMVNGRLYDCDTMNEIGNYDKKRGKFWWEIPGYNSAFPWHDTTEGHED